MLFFHPLMRMSKCLSAIAYMQPTARHERKRATGLYPGMRLHGALERTASCR
jgi:hypothetical protein